MKITLDINDIDYGALVELFLPIVKEKLAEKGGAGIAILPRIMPLLIAGKKIIDILPQETKDEIAVMLVNINKEKIMESIVEYAEKKGLSFRIADFDMK